MNKKRARIGNTEIVICIANPLVSVILPTYNRAHLLKRAIKSILHQTFSDFEIIVVDDCSSDGTDDVVASLSDERIRYIRHKKNHGAVAARNTGIKAARGDFVAFQDSDDEWLPRKLEKQMIVFDSATSDIGVVYTNYWRIHKGIITLFPPSNIKQTEGNIHKSLLETNYIGTPTSLVRRECFAKVGLFENLPCLQEWGLWLRISRYYTFRHIDEALVNAFQQTDSISRNIDSLIVSREYILKKYFSEISKDSKLLSQHYFEIGTLLCISGQTRRGREYFINSIRANPLSAKLQLSTVTSIFGKRVYDEVAGLYLRAKSQSLQN